VHAGDVLGDCCVGHGKTEAYFFPPLDVPPYNMQLTDVKTRLGLKPGVIREQVSYIATQVKNNLIILLFKGLERYK